MSGEKWQHFNQLLSQEERLSAAVLDFDGEQLAERIADNLYATNETLEQDSSRSSAAWALYQWGGMVLGGWDFLGDEWSGRLEIPEDLTRLGNSEPGPDTMWVVGGFRDNIRVAIAHLEQYRGVAEKYLAHIHFCQAGVSKACEGRFAKVVEANGIASAEYVESVLAAMSGDQSRHLSSCEYSRLSFEHQRFALGLIGMPNAVEPFATRYFRHKRGNIIVVAKVCSVCSDWMRHGNPEDVDSKAFPFLDATAVDPLAPLREGTLRTLDANDDEIEVDFPSTTLIRHGPLEVERQRKARRRRQDHMRARGLVDEKGNWTGRDIPADLWDDYPGG